MHYARVRNDPYKVISYPVDFESTSSDEIHFPVESTSTVWKEKKWSSSTVSESSEFRNWGGCKKSIPKCGLISRIF